MATRAHSLATPGARRGAPPPTAAAQTDSLIGGRWQPTRSISSGGNFRLYRVRAPAELGPGCYVVKMPRGDEPDVRLPIAQLQREAAVAATCCHPSLISVLANGLGDTPPHLVLPYFEGLSLRRLLNELDQSSAQAAQSTRRLPIATALALARQTAAALSVLNDAGWLHGQVRPEHIIVSPQAQATLIDLTYARRLASPEVTLCGIAPGQESYAAPEHGAATPLTAAADVYALGATLFEMLAGQPPFAGAFSHELAAQHRGRRSPEIRLLRPDASLEIAELLARMLSKEPLRRPAADELVRWLAELEVVELIDLGHVK